MAAARRYRNKRLGPAYKKPVHQNYRPGGTYISAGGQEFLIEMEGGLWYIKRYRGGQIRKNLSGCFTNFNAAERALIQYLDETDHLSYARWPGKNSRHGPFNGE